MSIHWWSLMFAGLLEIVWAAGFKFAFRENHFVSAGVVAAMIASFYFLWFAMRTIPVGAAYAIWTGIGAAGAALAGILIFNEDASVLRMACILLIVSGVAGLKLVSG